MIQALMMSRMGWWKENLLKGITNTLETLLSRMANGKKVHIDCITLRVHIPKITINQW